MQPSNQSHRASSQQSDGVDNNLALQAVSKSDSAVALSTHEKKGVSFDRLLDLYGTLTSPASNPSYDRVTRISEGTHALTQLEQLGRAAGGRCRSHLGALSLNRSIAAPPKEIDLVLARQRVVQELTEKNEQSQYIKRLLLEGSKPIEEIKSFLNHPGRRTFADLRRARAGVNRLAELVSEAPEITNPLIASSLEAIRNLTDSPVIRLIREPVCLVKGEPTPVKDAPLWNRFANRLINFTFGPKTCAAIVGSVAGFIGVKFLDVVKQPNEVFAILAYEMAVAVFAPLAQRAKPEREDALFFAPIAKRVWDDPVFAKGWTALGFLDEVHALAQLPNRYPEVALFPSIVESDRHLLEATNLHNPILALAQGRSVANDYTIDGSRVIGLTGPNSGGKSTFAITAIQTQVLAQIGAPVPASRFVVSIPDELFYQAQDFNQLTDKEGRFGTELLKTKEIFLRASPKTLAVFDELAQGTTHEESRNVADYILRGFKRLGSSTIFITHDHGVVSSLAQEGIVEPLAVEFRGGRPTHRIVPGVSTTSHALRVARKIEFDAKAVQEILHRRGLGSLN